MSASAELPVRVTLTFGERALGYPNECDELWYSEQAVERIVAVREVIAWDKGRNRGRTEADRQHEEIRIRLVVEGVDFPAIVRDELDKAARFSRHGDGVQ